MKRTPRKPKCPICREPVELRADNEYFPFCSSRCQMNDLGNWINEAYRIPVGNTSTERGLPPSDGGTTGADD